MGAVKIEIPESVLLTTGQSREEFVRDATLTVAAWLVETGRLSTGKAAEVCGMNYADFLRELGRRGVPAVSLDAEQIEREFGDG
jgi:predicted HTH domain antitoxin